MEGSELEKIVIEYMKSKKYQRSSTLFESRLKLQSRSDQRKPSDFTTLIRGFNNYLLTSEKRKSNELNDLGFEINFDIIPTTKKV